MNKLFRAIQSIIVTSLLITSVSFADTRVIYNGNPDIKEMALTFDDGYDVEKINKIKKILDAHQVKGTFFFVGSFMASHKEVIRDLEASGHMVVGHSFSHPDFTRSSDKKISGEMENTKIVYTKATDKKILPYMRPPYGAYNNRVLKTLGNKHDLYVMMWSIDTLDWKSLPANQLVNTVLNNAGNGKIVLMHTTKSTHIDQGLDRIIAGLKEKGYSMVRIDEMVSKLPEKERLASISYNPSDSEPGNTISVNSSSPKNNKPSSLFRIIDSQKNK